MSKDKLCNMEKNLNEELMINTSNKSGKLSNKDWDLQQKRSDQSLRLEQIDEKMKLLNSQIRKL